MEKDSFGDSRGGGRPFHDGRREKSRAVGYEESEAAYRCTMDLNRVSTGADSLKELERLKGVSKRPSSGGASPVHATDSAANQQGGKNKSGKGRNEKKMKPCAEHLTGGL